MSRRFLSAALVLMGVLIIAAHVEAAWLQDATPSRHLRSWADADRIVLFAVLYPLVALLGVAIGLLVVRRAQWPSTKTQAFGLFAAVTAGFFGIFHAHLTRSVFARLFDLVSTFTAPAMLVLGLAFVFPSRSFWWIYWIFLPLALGAAVGVDTAWFVSLVMGLAAVGTLLGGVLLALAVPRRYRPSLLLAPALVGLLTLFRGANIDVLVLVMPLAGLVLLASLGFGLVHANFFAVTDGLSALTLRGMRGLLAACVSVAVWLTVPTSLAGCALVYIGVASVCDLWIDSSLARALVALRAFSGGSLRDALDEHWRRHRRVLLREDRALIDVLSKVAEVAQTKAEVTALEKRAELSLWAEQLRHELLYPLNFFRHVFRRTRGDTEEGKVAMLEIERMARMISGLDDLSAPRPSSSRRVTWGEVVQRCLALCEVELAQIHCQVESGDWQTQEVEEDVALPILANLLRNAAQFARSQVIVRGCVIVEDDGPGVAERVLARLFSPHNTSRTNGAGVGLAIAHRLARQVGWELRYVRENDRTLFCLFTEASRSNEQAAARSRLDASAPRAS